jgi:O-antigen ligase
MNEARNRRPLPTIFPYIVLFFATTAAISAAKGEPGVAFGAAGACAVLTAVSLTPEPPYVVLARVRGFLRLQVSISLILGVLIPSWALVPAWHNSREFFGIGSRLIGLTAGPNYMGATAAVLLILEIFLATRGHLLRAIFGSLALTAVFWSQSRTAIVISALSCLLWIMARIMPQRSLAKLASLVIWVPILAMPVVPFVLLSFMDSRPDAVASFTTGRVYVWQAGLDAMSTAPFFGLTHEEFNAVMQRYSTSEFSNAHNQLLETWATGGAVMAAILILLLLSLGRSLVLQARNHLAPLALSFGVLGQLPFGTPFRLSGATWNLIAVSILILCTRPWVPPPSTGDPLPVPPAEGEQERGHPATRGERLPTAT